MHTIFDTVEFEYHTFLHHSQTQYQSYIMSVLFEYHTFLHHSQIKSREWKELKEFEYHTFLHHSQTVMYPFDTWNSLNTIHFYIILKL